MNDPNKWCPVCGLGYVACDCERDDEWMRACDEAEAEWNQGAGPEDFCDDDDDAESREEAEIENALNECGDMGNGNCMLAGTEYCEFKCPYNAVVEGQPDVEDEQ